MSPNQHAHHGTPPTRNERNPRPLPTGAFLLLLVILTLPSYAPATIEAVTVRLPQATAWVGQRLAFYLELRAPGSFAGSASFELPRMPGTILLKIGSPVVGSEEVDGTTWFVQTHEFALYSQRQGHLSVPPIAVRFTHRQGFSGPTFDAVAASPQWAVDIDRPPGSSDLGFLVTTESLQVSETWDPPVAPTTLGATFVRTIEQRATEVPGMALAPAELAVPDGVRTYARTPATLDHLERGEFLGARTDTITYLMQAAGTFEIPPLTYVWWNPRTQSLDSHTLPGARFEVSAPINSASTQSVDARRAIVVLALVGATLVLGWRRRHLAAYGRRIYQVVRSPERIAARQLLRACRRQQPADAHRAWATWRNLQGGDFQLDPDLHTAIAELQRCLYGREAERAWRAADLAHAFRRLRRRRHPARAQAIDRDLPKLNCQA